MRRTVRPFIAAAITSAVIASLAAGALSSCTDVGHPAEVGCLVDMNEPGCPGAQVGDASEAAPKAPVDAASVDVGSVDGTPDAARDDAPQLPPDAQSE
jgi:hypothetical protein